MKRIKILDCNNGDKLHPVDFRVACKACKLAYNDGLKNGIIIGIAAACIGIATVWTLNEIITSDKG